MAASVQFRPQNRDLGMVVREVDEDLAIFLGLKDDHLLIEDSDNFDYSSSVEPKPDTLLIPKALESKTVEIVADDNLLNLEIESQRNDYDWLTPEKIDAQGLGTNQSDVSNDESIPQKSKVTSSSANSRPSSSRDRKANSRASTPVRRASLPAKSKPSRASTPTSRATSEPDRASSRAASTSSKQVGAHVRSSTPSRATSRSSTPCSRPVISKSGSRSGTTACKPETTQSAISSLDRSSSGRKTTAKNPIIVKSRPSKPSEILSLSQDAPQNPRTSFPKRPASASRGRPSAQAATLSSSNGKPRQKSCSPAKVRAPNGTTRASTGTAAHKTGGIMLSRSRSYNHGGGDDVNPVLMGTKMVERVVNMRKLAPPKQDERIPLDNTKKTSQENSGFGRSLSKRSLDMAIRHMDIRRSIPDNLRPVATSFSSGNQSSSCQSSTGGFSDSPLTSASDSSKSSNCASSYFH